MPSQHMITTPFSYASMNLSSSKIFHCAWRNSRWQCVMNGLFAPFLPKCCPAKSLNSGGNFSPVNCHGLTTKSNVPYLLEISNMVAEITAGFASSVLRFIPKIYIKRPEICRAKWHQVGAVWRIHETDDNSLESTSSCYFHIWIMDKCPKSILYQNGHFATGQIA